MTELPKSQNENAAESQDAQVTQAVLSSAKPIIERSIAALEACETASEHGGPQEKARAETLGRRIWASAKHALIRLGLTAALFSAGVKAHEKAVSYEVVRGEMIDGQAEYQHEDAETTHILNVLSGKEKFNERERELFASDGLDFDARVYDAFWGLEQECGNPTIRWETDIEDSDLYAASYNPVTNTVFLKPGRGDLMPIQQHFVSELAHGKQFADGRLTFRHLMDGLGMAYRTLVGSVVKDIPLQKAYLQEYKVVGSNEFDAHQVIEPGLQQSRKLTKLLNEQDLARKIRLAREAMDKIDEKGDAP